MHSVPMPVHWESLLKSYVKKTFYAGTRKSGFSDREEFTEGDYRFFARGVARLNAFFTSERGDLPKNYFNQKDLRSGYLLYFLPVNALKVATLLSQNPILIASPSITILDIGSGPGTGLLGTMLWLEMMRGRFTTPPRIRWILVDQNKQILMDAKNLHDEIRKSLPFESTIDLLAGDLMGNFSKRLGGLKADLILSLNSLSEFSFPRQLSVVETLLRYLKEDGRLLIMEPALRKTTRDLMSLHDELVSRRSASILAPCLHQSACPMLLASRRDWCHTYIEWKRPPWIERIDQLVGIRKDYLKCSYLLLGRGESPHYAENSWRVVSGHLNSNGKSELLLCGPEGLPNLYRAVLLDRDRSDSNRLFDEIQRGETLQMKKTERVVRDTVISRPFSQ